MLRTTSYHEFGVTVTTIIENLPPKRSCGYDDISSIFLKQITTSKIKPLTIVINQVLKGHCI